jgi:hypothetical protein
MPIMIHKVKGHSSNKGQGSGRRFRRPWKNEAAYQPARSPWPEKDLRESIISGFLVDCVEVNAWNIQKD